MEPTVPPQPETKSNKVPQVVAVLVLIALIVFGLNKSFTKTDSNITAQVADTTSPVTTVTSPADGQVISGNFSTCATATDNVGVVTIVLHMGGIPASGTISPLCVGWNTVNFANGFYTVYSTASDAAGNTGTSPAILAGVANNLTTPIVKATMPAPSTIVSGQVTLGAKAYAPAGLARVDFLIDGTSTVVATATTPSSLNTYTAVWNSTTVVNGSHNIIAKVYDINGLSMVSGTTFTVTNNGTDTTPPVISAITSSSITTTGANISWTTNESATSQLTYGTTTAYGNLWPVSPDMTMVTSHSLQLSGLAPNTLYHFAVKSSDAAGNLATSTDQTFTTTTAPDTTPPTVSITAPTGGATLSGVITYSANASDNIGIDHVDFYQGNTIIGADATVPYSFSWDTATVANGAYTLTARAFDAVGNNTISTPVSVTVNNVVVPPPDTTPPTVAMTVPTGGSTVSGATVTVGASASDNIGVTLVEFYDGTNLISTDTTASPNYAVTWNTTSVLNGSHSLTAKAFDAAGNNTTSTSVMVTVSNTLPDTTLPTVSLTAPTASSTIFGTTTLTATASDNVGVTRVDFYNSNTLLGSDTTTPYSFAWDTTTVSYGTKSLKAKAYDAAGNVKTSSTVSVTLKDITPPTVTITSPTSTVLPQTGTVTISATASDPSGIKNIKILVDGVQKKQCTTSTSCSYNWSMTGIATGSHVITVTSQDKAPIANTGTATKTVTK